MDSDLSVEAIYDQWAASCPSEAPDRTQRLQRLRSLNESVSAARRQVKVRMEEASAADLAWLVDALADTDALALKWKPWECPRIRFAAFAIADVSQLPPEMFSMLVRAAVYDPDLSGPRFFIDPCSCVFGTARTTNALVDYLESGTNFEKAGAAFALYHAFFRFMDPSPTESEATLTFASRRALEVLLRAFLQNEDVHVQREAAGTLGMFPAETYPTGLRELVDQVIVVGSEHADEYVRYTVRSWVGTWKGDPVERSRLRRPGDAGSG